MPHPTSSKEVLGDSKGWMACMVLVKIEFFSTIKMLERRLCGSLSRVGPTTIGFAHLGSFSGEFFDKRSLVPTPRFLVERTLTFRHNPIFKSKIGIYENYGGS